MMKKTITALAVCGVFLVTAAPAQAAPTDPVRALKAKLVPGHGVRFTETAEWSDGTDTLHAYENRGVLQFAKKGLNYDLTITAWDDTEERVISTGGRTYYSGGALAEYMPKGKRWLRLKGGGALPGVYLQVLNPAEPATLSALLKKGKREGSKVTGTITFAALTKVSPWFAGSELSTWAAGTPVSYTLTLAPSGLPTRLWSSFRAKGVDRLYADFEGSIINVDTRYTGWGGKVSVKAPSPGTVTDRFAS